MPPKGSRWYVFGRHYEVVGYGQRDGEPAVYLRDCSTRRKVRVPVLWRLAERTALACQ